MECKKLELKKKRKNENLYDIKIEFPKADSRKRRAVEKY